MTSPCSKYQSGHVKEWLAEKGVRYTISGVRRPAGAKGYVHLPKRWVVERSLAWSGRWRRLSKDYEQKPEHSEAMLQISGVALMTRRLGGDKPKQKFFYKWYNCRSYR